MTGTFVGVLPAAGRGSRLAPLRYPKELLPIIYEPAGGDGAGVRARAVAEYALAAIASADADRVLLVVAPWKLDVLNYFGDGRHVGLEIGYLYQEEARGLPYALDPARSWTRGDHVIFAMPDTIPRRGPRWAGCGWTEIASPRCSTSRLARRPPTPGARRSGATLSPTSCTTAWPGGLTIAPSRSSAPCSIWPSGRG